MALLSGFDAAPIKERLKPLLACVPELTQEPTSVTEADAQAWYCVGWGEKALHDAIMFACTFNFMNRLLKGHGVHGNDALYSERGPMLKQHSYLPLFRLLKPRPAAK